MEKKNLIITECFKCGKRYENHFRASPCCQSIMMKINERGERTTISFLGCFFIPPSGPKESPEYCEEVRDGVTLEATS